MNNNTQDGSKLTPEAVLELATDYLYSQHEASSVHPEVYEVGDVLDAMIGFSAQQTAALQARVKELEEAIENSIATFEWLNMIGGKGLLEHERMREFITKYKPIIDKIKT